MKNNILTFLIICFGSSVFAQMTVNTFDNKEHLGGDGTQVEVFTFPDDVSMYDQVLMHIDLNCASVGCDPFDRVAHIKIIQNNEVFEIGRYVTPFGLGTCGWTLDVTPYREMLTGDVTLQSEIETFANGWDLTLDFEFFEGASTFEHTKIENLWEGFDETTNRSYFNFKIGDTLWTKDDLPVREVLIDNAAEEVILRIFNTGHGQGNTLNMAEFNSSTHTININGSNVADHTLWKTDCAQNPCANQNGTWEFSRAGWCPGQEVPAVDIDITDYVTPGETAIIDYLLDPYLNKCSPLYPDCNPSSDCAFGTQIGCNFDGNLHTEPRYKMSIQLITKSNNALRANHLKEWTRFEVFPNPSTAQFWVDITFEKRQNATMNIVDALGKVVFQKEFSNHKTIKHELDLSALKTGIYFLEVTTNDGRAFKKLILE